MLLAHYAHLRFRKGFQPAAPNPAGRAAYALAKLRGEPLLSKGEGFAAHGHALELCAEPVRPCAPTIPQVIAAAYSNSAVGTAPGVKGTILFDVDDPSDAIFAQVPANAGTLNAVGGQLGISPDQVGFDIATDRRGRNTAWLINGNRLYRPDLLSGFAGEGKRIRGLTVEVRDLAVLPSRR